MEPTTPNSNDKALVTEPKESQPTPKEKAREELIKKIKSRCFKLYNQPSPYYYVPLTIGAILSIKRKSNSFVPLVISAGIARKADYIIAEHVKDTLNLADKMNDPSNSSLLEKLTTYDEHNNKYVVQRSKFLNELSLMEKVKNEKYKTDHSGIFHSTVNERNPLTFGTTDLDESQVNITTQFNTCNLL
ncbi:MAG: hypothetical protein VX777_00025 [Chlamydiota bacterium]|nr:hypothetical protein [Chlamydiota bacterium]